MKILMIGLGSIGQRHVRNIRRVYGDAIELSAYRVRRLQQTFSDTMQIRDGVNLEEEFHIKCYSDLDEALAAGQDIVYVTNITSKHMECALKAAKAGCHIFLEKPVSDSMEGVEELQKIVNENGCKVFMGYQNRYHVCVQKLREYLEEDKLGKLISVDAAFCERLATMHTYEDYAGTYMANKNMGGGPVLNLQIHDIDILQWLFGMPKEGSVKAIMGTHSRLEIDVEDHAVISYVAKYAGRVGKDGFQPASADADYEEVTVTTRSDFLQYPPVHKFTVVGEKARVELDFNQAKIDYIPGEGECESKVYGSFQRNDMFITELKSFMDSVENDTPLEIPLEEGIKGLQIALEAKKSAGII